MSEETPTYDMSIHSNPDAMAWAEFYKETFPDADLELMQGWFANAMMAMSDYKDQKQVRPSEAIFAFCAWMTCRQEAIIIGAAHNAAPLVPLIGAFIESQEFDEPREDYTDRIKAYPEMSTINPPCSIKETKQFRKDLDKVLQSIKEPATFRTSRERSLAITKIQEGIMWLGMDLKAQNEENPYPESKNPENAQIEPTTDGLKL